MADSSIQPDEQTNQATNGQPDLVGETLTVCPHCGREFWRTKTFEELAKEQGVKPLDRETLEAMGSVWPEDEDIDEFIAWYRKDRRTGTYDF